MGGRRRRVTTSAVPIYTADDLGRLDRGELLDMARHNESMEREWIKRMVVAHDRIDILATEVLGYEVQPFHLGMLQWQFKHPKSLNLAWRGSGKSTTCTVVKAISLLIKDPNLRILLASKSLKNAQGFLKEIKGHLERNKKLIETFGEFYDPARVGKWDDTEIEVLTRTKNTKEASVTCVGIESTIVSKHYDVIISDDLVDEDNSRTRHMRERTHRFYYSTLDPTLEPPDPNVPHRGEHHHLGTRYHFDDLWGTLSGRGGELEESTQVIDCLDENGRSAWPEKFPPEWFEAKRKNAGIIIFNSQYRCDTEAMKGEIFAYDECQPIDERDIPGDLAVYQGVDLAIGQSEQHDKFAHVTIGVRRDTGDVYVLDYYEGQLRFVEQGRKIVELYRRHDPIRCCIESNAYQASQYQTLKSEHPDMRLVPVNQHKDKITRAQKLSALFNDGKMWFRRGHHLLVEHLVLFPSAPHDDLFDALDLAVRASKMRRRRKRRSEPGVIGG